MAKLETRSEKPRALRQSTSRLSAKLKKLKIRLPILSINNRLNYIVALEANKTKPLNQPTNFVTMDQPATSNDNSVMEQNASLAKVVIALAELSRYLVDNDGPASLEEPTCLGDKIIRLPTVVRVVTGGGRLGQDDKMTLGTYVKSELSKLPQNRDRRWQRVRIGHSKFENGIRVVEQINIVKYTREDLTDLTIAVAKFLDRKRPEIIY